MKSPVLATLFLASALVPQQLRWEPFEFTTRGGETVDGAQLGFLRVPEDHGRPEGRRIELAMVRLPTTAASPGHPIVYLAGGPGGSGIELAGGGRFPLFQALRAFGDVIALDQRGAGRSRPALEWSEPLDIPLDAALTYDQLLDHYRRHIERGAAHYRDQGIDLALYHTDASADDLELLRRSLGAKQLRLVGMSYGTHLGLAMLRRHPESVERIVLAGVEGPDHTLKLPSSLEAGLDRAAKLLASDPATASVMPDFRELLGDLIARLQRQPATTSTLDPRTGTEVDVAIGPLEVRLFAAALVSRRDSLPYIPRMFLPMVAGDFSQIAPLVVQMRRDTLNFMELAMDAASFASEPRLTRVLEESETALLRGVLNFPLPELRDAIGVPLLPDTFREPVTSNVPTLFISGTLDARTPITNAEEVRRGFPRSEHVIVDGAGHDDSLLVGSPLILDAIRAFLKTDVPPQTRIVLPPIAFALPPAARTAARRVLIEHASVLDPGGDAWLQDRAVLVEADRIVRVDESTAIEPTPGIRRIDAGGRYLIPGLWDMHVHLSKVRRPALPLFVYHGVTGVRDLGSELREVRAWQRAMRTGQLAGPRVLTVGSYLEHPDNVARMLRDNVVEPVERARVGVTDPEHARRVVAELAAQGVDGIKLRTFIDRETYYAIGEAAAAAGLPLYGHAQELRPEDVLRAGQRSIEHGFIPPLAARPEEQRRKLCRTMAGRGVALVPTLAVWEHSLSVPRDEAEAVLNATKPGRHGLRPYVAAFTLADWREQAAERSPGALRLFRSMRRQLERDARTMRAAGMPVLPGSDTAVLLMQPGASLHDELALFVEKLEMSPAEALRSATIESAEFLGLDRDLGTIAPGKLADLVLLDDDPLADIENVRSVHSVLAAGRWYGPDDREALLESIRSMPELAENDWIRPERR